MIRDPERNSFVEEGLKSLENKFLSLAAGINTNFEKMDDRQVTCRWNLPYLYHAISSIVSSMP